MPGDANPAQSERPTGANTAARELALVAAAAISNLAYVEGITPVRRADRGIRVFDVDLGNRTVQIIVSADG